LIWEQKNQKDNKIIVLLEKEKSMEWKFKKDVSVYTEEFWYDLTDGGYIIPEEILEDDEQIKELNKAIELVLSFEKKIDEMMDKGE
jgi:hypothetical protein